MAERVSGSGGWVEVAGGGCVGGGEVDVAFERAADDLAGAEADGEGEGEDDTAEEDAKGEFDDGATDLEVIEDHGSGEDEHEPFDAEGEEACVLEAGVDGTDEDRTGEEASDEVADDEQQDCTDGVGEIGQQEDGDGRVVGEGGIEGGDADAATDEDAGPEDEACDEQGGAVGGGPVGDGGGLVACDALVEVGGGEDAAQGAGEESTDGGHDEDGDEERDEPGEEAGEFEQCAVGGLAEREVNLLPHDESPYGCLLLFVTEQVANRGWCYGLKRSGQRQRETR